MARGNLARLRALEGALAPETSIENALDAIDAGSAAEHDGADSLTAEARQAHVADVFKRLPRAVLEAIEALPVEGRRGPE